MPGIGVIGAEVIIFVDSLNYAVRDGVGIGSGIQGQTIAADLLYGEIVHCFVS
ncbi:MAG: hypothetical protein QNJ78_15190 [Gammaproteobacteria bacterium]|nr:hypothetical protein [Gammaproteobacteria bacterium]